MTSYTVKANLPSTRYPHGSALTHAEREETVSIYCAVIAAAVAAVFTLIYTAGMRDVSVVGNGNVLARLTLYAALVIALTVAPYSYIRGAQWRNSLMPANRQTNWPWRAVPVTLSALFVNFVLVLVGLVLVSRAFPELKISQWAAPVTMGMTAAGITYITVHVFYNLRAPNMLNITLATLFGTLLFAGSMHTDANWFVQSFSHLGATDTNMSYIFNAGIIFAGILLIVWQQFLMDDLLVLQKRELVTPQAMRILQYGLILVAILLAGVGATPWGISPLINFLHILAAGGAGVGAGVLIIAMWWLIPWFPRWFYYAGWMLVAMTIIVVILKLMDYVWLTGMQFAGFTMVAFWLIMFMRSAENLVQRTDPATRLLGIYENIEAAPLASAGGQQSRRARKGAPKPARRGAGS